MIQWLVPSQDGSPVRIVTGGRRRHARGEGLPASYLGFCTALCGGCGGGTIRGVRRVPVELRAVVRRRRWGRWGFRASLVFLALLVTGEHFGCFGWVGSDRSRFDQKVFTIEAVTRSGTFLVAAESVRAEVRMIGVDEQTVQPQACAAYLGRQVVVKLESLQTRDRRGRLMAYLYLDERTVLNVELVRAGAGKVDRSFPHSYRAMMEGAEEDARKHGRGVWGARR